MAIFGWVPFQDTDWLVDMVSRANGIKILPLADGNNSPNAEGKFGKWEDVKANDIIFIAAHGRKYTTESVAWKVGDQLVTWSAAKLAQEMWLRLGATRSSLSLEYRLLACFGANNITAFAESFGAKLAKEMAVIAMRGSLTAYKGATGMNANKGKQFGDSRITCAFSMLRHGTTAKGKTTSESGKTWILGAIEKTI